MTNKLTWELDEPGVEQAKYQIIHHVSNSPSEYMLHRRGIERSNECDQNEDCPGPTLAKGKSTAQIDSSTAHSSGESSAR